MALTDQFVEKTTLEFGLGERSVPGIFSSSSSSSLSLSLSLTPPSGKHKKTHFYELSYDEAVCFEVY
ncbi:hypothetical protein OIU84_008530 [Salix udensis]|uniref:Uncharacterized protein n=1 Tax=Salix udensis TaxID=889485 RepID=A0AAD6NXM7_9ROSI|nr:hypothetical protein OIU84_008530 [Salix udensis]